MTTGNAHVILTQGTQQIAASAPWAAGQAVLWIAAALVVIGAAYLVARLRLPKRRAPFPKEPMFYEHGHVVDPDGRQAILRRAREEDRLEAEADAMAAEYRRQEGEGR